MKLFIRPAYFILAIIAMALPCFSQSHWTMINADTSGIDCYRLTKSMDHKKGAAWSDKMLNLKKPFDLYFQLNFGSKDNGADGIAVVLQKSPMGMDAIGDDGQYLGFASDVTPIIPSIDIEFDTYQNSWPTNDPVDDHCSIEGNGSIGWSLAAPVPMIGPGINVEDDQYHIVQVSWLPSANTLTVYFDCNLVQTLTYPLLDWIFSGDSMIYYGLTSATGGSNNTQHFCELYNDAGNDTTFCPGQQVVLSANSNFSLYSWSPAQGLSCTDCLNPQADPSATTTYVLTSTFGCLTALDSVTLTNDCIILPIELTSFTAQCMNDEVGLKWSTASELNNDYYVVERSLDAREFETITTLDGAGTSSLSHQYSFIDQHPLYGDSYYRLKQVDFDGTKTYSSVQHISCNSIFSLFIYPNPSNEITHLQIQSSASTQGVCMISNAESKIIFVQQLKLKEGSNDMIVNDKNYPAGIYHVIVISGSNALNSLMVIQ